MTTTSIASTQHLTLDALRSGPPTVSVDRAAEYLGVSRAYAYVMAREGRLPAIKLGRRRVRVSSAGLLRLLTGDQ
jgi:excisionase family DNA binding protein